jgi:glycosyltransferase involved in cell wall biosynthesis
MGDDRRVQRSIRSIAMLGNHLPRQCGIATFTTDLSEAIVSETSLECFVVAMNDPGGEHAYPPPVRFEVADRELDGYRRAREFLNASSADVLSVQHEYGIFGGSAGRHVLELLRDLKMPIVTTLHTILETPDAAQRSVMDALLALSERVVVMSADGARLLGQVHGVEPGKIDVIHHGIPAGVASTGKGVLGVGGSSVILTFGLLSPDKGIEHVIDAMPAILARHPNTVYVVLGATHPHVKQQHGEAYREMLQARARELGVQNQVIFHNRFVSHEELVELLGAADLYVTPYLKEEQSTSGTLAYAVGCGKAVISTPYRYARELLGDDRGVLVPWRDSTAIGRAVIELLDDPAKRAALQKRAAAFGRSMGWPLVARSYLASFEKALAQQELRRRRPVRALAKPLPELNLSHLRQMTDDTGLLQHATYAVPSYRDGYCVDDNARALLLMTQIEEAGGEATRTVRALTTRYLAFVHHAFEERTGRFHNFLSYSRQWDSEPGSDDSQGPSLWALGAVIGRSPDAGKRALASRMFQRAVRETAALTSPRAWAYVLLGIEEYLRAFEGDREIESVRATLVARLVERFEHSQTNEWPWFEDRLTYCNARLPQALLVSATRMHNAEAAAIAMRALEWLVMEHVGPGDMFAPVGSNGFHVRGETRAVFDQQPVEATAMVSACIDAHRVTGDPRWLEHARRAFDWFVGRNSREQSVYDAETGGCRDGIHIDRMNENQGAESTLSYLAALVDMRAAELRATRFAPVLKTRMKSAVVSKIESAS